MCLSGGFCNKVILSSSNVVQSGDGNCMSSWSHISSFGLSVIISANRSRGGGWCWL